MDLADLTATAARARIEAGQLTPAALMEACLARIAAAGTGVARDGVPGPGAWRGRLCRHGAARPRCMACRLGVKDVLDTADMPAEYNSPIWRGHRPRADAAAVAWARAAGRRCWARR